MNPYRRLTWIGLGTVTLLSLACTCNSLTGIGREPYNPVTEEFILSPQTPVEVPVEIAPAAEQPSGAATKPPIGGAPGGNSGYDTEFPLPDDVSNFTALGDGQINFFTTMPLADVPGFYRQAFAEAGYIERELLTVISEQAVSMVWDGHASGNAIVVQAVDLGGGQTNINIRLEAIP